MTGLELKFYPPDLAQGARILAEAVGRGARRIGLGPLSPAAHDIVQMLAPRAGLEIFALGAAPSDSLPARVSRAPDGATLDALLVLPGEAGQASRLFAELTNLTSGTIFLPDTGRLSQTHPLFLISIPKAGTHLLFNLVEAFGYARGVEHSGNPRPGYWYCVEFSNTHTSARDFFIDSVRRAPFGNRAHPFVHNPAIFIYRNPLDILVSEIAYYHKDGNAAFGGYLSTLSPKERLLRLIDDPWLFGNVRDRLGQFIPWLDFPNVVPVSFEELIGPKGGGDMWRQIQLIWSLQLKLGIAGRPETFADKVFSSDSPTFNKGQINTYVESFDSEAMAHFDALPQDFMDILGYGLEGTQRPRYSGRIDEFRHRLLIVPPNRFDDFPIEVGFNFLDHNIMRLRGRYYAVPIAAGKIDLASIDPAGLDRFANSVDLDELKFILLTAASGKR